MHSRRRSSCRCCLCPGSRLVTGLARGCVGGSGGCFGVWLKGKPRWSNWQRGLRSSSYI